VAACVSGCGVCVLRGVHATQHTNQAQYRLPDDGASGPKHVGVTAKKCFNP